MSVDSTALERSALERKDRDELLTIAKALGGKPPARAKKADIVDLVLQLTGVEGDDAPAAAPRPPPRRPRPRRRGPAPGSPRPQGRAAAAGPRASRR